MIVGLIGMGKIGSAHARRWIAGGLDVVVYDADPALAVATTETGITLVNSLEALVQNLKPPRTIDHATAGT